MERDNLSVMPPVILKKEIGVVGGGRDGCLCWPFSESRTVMDEEVREAESISISLAKVALQRWLAGWLGWGGARCLPSTLRFAAPAGVKL